MNCPICSEWKYRSLVEICPICGAEGGLKEVDGLADDFLKAYVAADRGQDLPPDVRNQLDLQIVVEEMNRCTTKSETEAPYAPPFEG